MNDEKRGAPTHRSSFIVHRFTSQRLLIVVAVIVVFGRLAFHEFTGWDDPATIHQNPSFNPPTLRKVAWYWTAWGDRAPMGLYVPLTYTVWGVLAKLAYLQTPDPTGIRLNPYVYHSANVVLHALTALAVFEILRRLVDRAGAACAGAMLFALHPVQVEPVGWASGTKDVLCGLLAMVALWQYVLSARDDPPAAKDGASTGRAHYTLGLFAFAGAMLAKPTGVVVPLMALVVDVFILRRPLTTGLRALLPWFALAIPFALVARATQSTEGLPQVPLALRPLIATDALAFYLYKLVGPVQLGVDYARRPARVIEAGWLWYTWLAPAAVAAALWLVRRRAGALVAAGLLFVAGVLPVLGFVPFQFQYYTTVADHYLYLSMLGPAIALAWVVARWPTRGVAVACAVLLVLLGARSFDQGKYWRDDVTLFEHTLDVSPQSFVSHNNLAAALFQRGALENSAELIRRSEFHFREAIRIFPEYPSGHDNLANVLVRTGRLEEAVHHMTEMLRLSESLPPNLRPNLDRAHNDLGVYLLSRGQVDEAVERFRSALKVNPAKEQAKENLVAALDRQRAAATRPAATTGTATTRTSR